MYVQCIMLFVQEKPTECPICFEPMMDINPLSCGHWIHRTCIRKSNTILCPLCRHSVLTDIKVQKQRPNTTVMTRYEIRSYINKFNTIHPIEYFKWGDMEEDDLYYTYHGTIHDLCIIQFVGFRNDENSVLYKFYKRDCPMCYQRKRNCVIL
jgi:hypothetical protein